VTASSRKGGAEPNRNNLPTANDPVLAALRQAEERYREMLLSLEQKLVANERELARAGQDNAGLTEELAARDRELGDARRRVDDQRQTGESLSAALKDIHRALFTGNVYELILRACLSLTGATRGLYATLDGPDEQPRIRAAIDVGDHPSESIRQLCRAALENDAVTTCAELAPLPDDARGGGDAFRNCLAMPVVLRGHPGGVVIVADKPTGDFDEDDADLLLTVGNHAAVAIENAHLQHEIQDAYLSIVSVLANTMAARTQFDGHAEDEVCRLASAVAERLNLTEYQRSVVYYAALLHDIGYVGVSDGVLNKPGPLLDAERELIRAHVQIGHDLVREVPHFEAVAAIVRLHHERYDGQGYPDALKGDEIPIEARIVSVADAYGAMLAPRSYRPDLTREEACEQLRRGAGTQFDPHVVEAFLVALEAPPAPAAELEPRGVSLPGIDVHHAVSSGAGSN